MFCVNCGKKFNDGTSFCPECGFSQNSNISTVNTSYTVPVTDDRSVLLEYMNGSFDVMTSIKNQELLIEEHETKVEKFKKKSRKCCIIPFVITFSVIALFFEPLQTQILQNALLIIGIVLGILYILSNRKKVRQLKDKISECNEIIEDLKKDSAIAWLPYDYRDSTAFAYIFQYVQNFRANSLKEAINLYETEKHQARLKAMSALTAMAAQDAANSANAAAGVATAGAFFSLFK